MLYAQLQRDQQSEEGTFGSLVIAAGAQTFLCVTGEPPLLEATPELGCIPAGTYNVAWRKAAANGKPCYVVEAVPGREAIEVHAGRFCGSEADGFKTDTHGSLLPGREVGDAEGQQCLVGSPDTLAALIEFCGQRPFLLRVKDVATSVFTPADATAAPAKAKASGKKRSGKSKAGK